IVEVYDAGNIAGPSRLINLSTRGHVGLGSNIMIAGLVVEGPGPRTYLLRAVGDTLGTFGISGYLDDPFMRLYRDNDLARTLDDWDQPGAHQDMLRTTMADLGAVAL